ncbi:MAG: serine/threonine protein kinase PkaE [Myxococcales bacterium]
MDRTNRGASAAENIADDAGCRGCGAPFERSLTAQDLCDACQGLIAPDPVSPAQESVAGYRLVRRLGAGRFSTSWLAETPDGGDAVLKLLRPDGSPAFSLPSFVEEAQRLSAAFTRAPRGVARLLDGGATATGAPFLVYATGGELTLADELRSQGQVALPRALELCAQLAEALDAVHAAGVLHLDLKPANVGLADAEEGAERAVLLDAATSHLLGHPKVGDGAALPLSSAAYVSPEQARGQPAGKPADLYSLGVLLYQLVTGGLPVHGSSSAELIRSHRDQRPLRLRDGGSRVNPALEAAIARLLAKDPGQRFRSGAELAATLRALTAEPEAHELGVVPKALPPEPAWSLRSSPSAPDADVTYGPRAPPEVEEALARAMLDGTLPRQRSSRWRPAFRQRGDGIRRWATPARLTPIAFALVLAGSAILALRSARAPPTPAGVELAQLQLDRERPAEAKRTLHAVLARSDLKDPERARASFLLAAAHEASGERQAALTWYRRCLRTSKDPQERARAAKRLHALAR